jgi:hypothetical protein
MTRDDIIRMAREAGFATSWTEAAGDALERFAALVAAQRQWVGLTVKDLAEIPPSAYEGAIWADAKLKEKNT